MKSLIGLVCILFIIAIGCDCQREYNEYKTKLELATTQWMLKNKKKPIVNTYKNCLNGEDLIATILNQKLNSLKYTKKPLETVIDSVHIITTCISNYNLVSSEIEHITMIYDKNKNQYIFGFDGNYKIIVIYSNFEFLLI